MLVLKLPRQASRAMPVPSDVVPQVISGEEVVKAWSLPNVWQ